jgi:hypothetical protein
MAMAASPSRRFVPSRARFYSAGDRLRIHAFELLEMADVMDSPSQSVVASDARADIVEEIAADVRAVVRGPCCG